MESKRSYAKKVEIVNVRIGDLQPNPIIKDFKKYPFDEAKINALVNSITETGFWANVLIRRIKVNKKAEYQVAYGHHRIKAAGQVYGDNRTVQLPCTELSDAKMVKIMGNENMEEFATTPQLINTFVSGTKEYLLEHPDEVRPLVDKSRTGETTKVLAGLKEGKLGAPIISRFLGENWPESRVQEGLKEQEMIDEGKLDEDAVKTTRNQAEAKRLREMVEKESIPMKDQKKAAEEISGKPKRKRAEKSKEPKPEVAESEEPKSEVAEPEVEEPEVEEPEVAEPEEDGFVYNGKVAELISTIDQITKELNFLKLRESQYRIAHNAEVLFRKLKDLHGLIEEVVSS